MTLDMMNEYNYSAGKLILVVFGSERGLDPTRRTVYREQDLRPPRPHGDSKDTIASVLTADLDGDGFSDFVTRIGGQSNTVERARTDTYVSWGGPTGPRHGVAGVRLRLPAAAAAQGLSELERGDFDGDGHQDLAGVRADEKRLELLYGPFTRAGVPARTDGRSLPRSRMGANTGIRDLLVDEPAKSGHGRVTGLFIPFGTEEQKDGVLYAAGPDGIARTARWIRAGNAYAFGDFEGDGARDLAVGDSGTDCIEPSGCERVPPEFDGNYTIYSGNGTSRSYRLPQRDVTIREFYAVDTDGDGEDTLMVFDIDNGAVFLDGARETGRVSHSGPSTYAGRRVARGEGTIRVDSIHDFDGDGPDELVLNWIPKMAGVQVPMQWWVMDVKTREDETSFAIPELF